MTTQKKQKTQKKQDFALGEANVKARKPKLIGIGEQARPMASWTPLVDWGEVYPGNRGVNRRGEYELYDAPVGVALRVEEADKSEVVIDWDQPWEGKWAQLIPMALWQADGRYHLLYNALDRARYVNSTNPTPSSLGGARVSTCYAVSDDAYHWTKPKLGLREFNGSTDNNLVSQTLTGTPLIDLSAAGEDRFRAMGQEGGSFDPRTGEQLTPEEAAKRLRAIDYEGDDYKGPRMEARHWISGWASADGLHWRSIEKHLAEMPSDGGSAAHFDAETGTYFAYLRTAGMGRRALGLSRTHDFWQWPYPQLVLFPDPQDAPDVSFYGCNYFRYPDHPDLHGMALQIYHQVTDHMDNQLAFSRDGVHWYRPERRAAIPSGRAGAFDEGFARCAQTGITVLPDGRWGVLFEGSRILHNALGALPYDGSRIAWARWRPHRLCGIEADHEGRFTFFTVQRSGKELRLNYRCKLGGWIRVELIRTIPSRLQRV